MATTDYKVRLAASNMAKLMQEWPDLRWEDVQGINRHVGFTHATRGEGMVDVAGVGTGGGRLGRTDLRQAWELAREMHARDYTESAD
jgi:hypothetical protein